MLGARVETLSGLYFCALRALGGLQPRTAPNPKSEPKAASTTTEPWSTEYARASCVLMSVLRIRRSLPSSKMWKYACEVRTRPRHLFPMLGTEYGYREVESCLKPLLLVRAIHLTNQTPGTSSTRSRYYHGRFLPTQCPPCFALASPMSSSHRRQRTGLRLHICAPECYTRSSSLPQPACQIDLSKSPPSSSTVDGDYSIQVVQAMRCRLA